MNMRCPQCMGPLEVISSNRARCTLEGVVYDILYMQIPTNDATSNAVAAGIMCTCHPAVQATQQCASCSAPICETCDFEFQGGIHLCPNCATKPQQALSPKRRKLVWWSIGLAAWSTLWTIALILIAAVNLSSHSEELLGVLLMYLCIVPSLIGTALGMASFDRRLSNPGIVWVGALWNGIILALLILLCIIGLASS